MCELALIHSRPHTLTSHRQAVERIVEQRLLRLKVVHHVGVVRLPDVAAPKVPALQAGAKVADNRARVATAAWRAAAACAAHLRAEDQPRVGLATPPLVGCLIVRRCLVREWQLSGARDTRIQNNNPTRTLRGTRTSRCR